MVKDNLKIASFALGAFVRDTAAEKAAVSRAGGLAFGDETECKILRGKTLVVEWSHQEVLAGMTTSRTKIEVALSACPRAVLNGKTVTVAIAGDVKVHSGVQPFDYAKRQRGKCQWDLYGAYAPDSLHDAAKTARELVIELTNTPAKIAKELAPLLAVGAGSLGAGRACVPGNTGKAIGHGGDVASAASAGAKRAASVNALVSAVAPGLVESGLLGQLLGGGPIGLPDFDDGARPAKKARKVGG